MRRKTSDEEVTRDVECGAGDFGKRKSLKGEKGQGREREGGGVRLFGINANLSTKASDRRRRKAGDPLSDNSILSEFWGVDVSEDRPSYGNR